MKHMFKTLAATFKKLAGVREPAKPDPAADRIWEDWLDNYSGQYRNYGQYLEALSKKYDQTGHRNPAWRPPITDRAWRRKSGYRSGN